MEGWIWKTHKNGGERKAVPFCFGSTIMMATQKFPSIYFSPLIRRRIIDCSKRFRLKWSVKSRDERNDFGDGWKRGWWRKKDEDEQQQPQFFFVVTLESNFKVLDCIWFIFTRKSSSSFLSRTTQGRQLRWWQIDHCYRQPNSRHPTAPM